MKKLDSVQPGGKELFASLEKINRSKESLLKDIRKDQSQIRFLWNKILRQYKSDGKAATTKIGDALRKGSGVVDGLALGWKLYRKYIK